MNYPTWLPKWLTDFLQEAVSAFQTNLIFRTIIIAAVVALVALVASFFVGPRHTNKSAKKGSYRMAGLLVTMGSFFLFLSRVSQRAKETGRFGVGLIWQNFLRLALAIKNSFRIVMEWARAAVIMLALKFRAIWKDNELREFAVAIVGIAVLFLFVAAWLTVWYVSTSGLGGMIGRGAIALLAYILLLVTAVAVLTLTLGIVEALAWVSTKVFAFFGNHLLTLGTDMVALEKEAQEIRELRQKPELAPVGVVFYHAVENSARTGKLYKGFLPKEAIEDKENAAAALPTKLVLLINGTGYWLEKPERLRRHTKVVEVPAEPGREAKKEEITLYDEAKTFRELSGAGTLFGWRVSNWRLLDSGNCEVELHGIHPHFRSVSLVPFEKVRYWLATMAAGEGEKQEGPNEVLLVEEILGSWGEHQGLLRMFAWTGIELPQGEVEEARVFLSTINPKEIKPAVPAFAE